MRNLLEQFDVIPPGTIIPKPKAKKDFSVHGWGERRGGIALIYNIPNHSSPSKPHRKGITREEWARSVEQLLSSGEFRLDWFKTNLPACHKEGSCNFTTIGGLLAHLGAARYARRGVYERVGK
ncbi:MAG: hypothetical protein FalmKO_39860 [Falsiruegeria mediterranea]